MIIDIAKSLQIIKDFKPDVVIGVGGYVTYPVISAAHDLNIKTVIHEQNSIPGKSNTWLSDRATQFPQPIHLSWFTFAFIYRPSFFT